MLDVSLRELEYVVAVHRERGFTRAARHLHMAQPALSQAIIRLERRLGVSLFERTSRRVEPTPAGEEFAREARDIIDRVRVAVTNVTGRPPQVLTVHVSEPALETPRRLMAALRATDPDLSVHLTTLPRSLTGDDSARAQLSVTIGEPIRVPGAVSEPIRSERVGALMTREHPLIDAAVVTADDLERYPVVSIDDQLSRWNRWVTGWMREQGKRPRWTTSAVFGIVAGSDMVTDDHCLFVCLESVASDVPEAFTWTPLAPTATATWYLNWMQAQADSVELARGLDIAHDFATQSGWTVQTR
ncbi:LysR family transcriptional regulator [Gordonia sp. CPCC 206044]|uniref:LysR family transcriptional regulator n=1 Tax=Gordonia sp. CPCC 206044 TaxID=3140793 RepID=UPI003AF355F8